MIGTNDWGGNIREFSPFLPA